MHLDCAEFFAVFADQVFAQPIVRFGRFDICGSFPLLILLLFGQLLPVFHAPLALLLLGNHLHLWLALLLYIDLCLLLFLYTDPGLARFLDLNFRFALTNRHLRLLLLDLYLRLFMLDPHLRLFLLNIHIRLLPLDGDLRFRLLYCHFNLRGRLFDRDLGGFLLDIDIGFRLLYLDLRFGLIHLDLGTALPDHDLAAFLAGALLVELGLSLSFRRLFLLSRSLGILRFFAGGAGEITGILFPAGDVNEITGITPETKNYLAGLTSLPFI